MMSQLCVLGHHTSTSTCLYSVVSLIIWNVCFSHSSQQQSSIFFDHSLLEHFVFRIWVHTACLIVPKLLWGAICPRVPIHLLQQCPSFSAPSFRKDDSWSFRLFIFTVYPPISQHVYNRFSVDTKKKEVISRSQTHEDKEQY